MYTLSSSNILLEMLRKQYPISSEVAARIVKSDVLTLDEWIMAHYEIDPFRARDDDFARQFLENDPFHIVELAKSGYARGAFKFIAYKTSQYGVVKEEYVRWAAEKGFSLPLCLMEKVKKWEPPLLCNVEAIKSLDYGTMPLSVLIALGANVIAQLKKRAKSDIRIADVYNSQPMHKFLQDVAEVEGKDKGLRAESTIRQLIQEQFRDTP